MTTMNVHKMSKNTVVERVVATVVSRYGGEDRESKQLSVPGAIDGSFLTSTTMHFDCKWN